jgi:hypothetical protein
MPDNLAARLETLQPAIKACWAALLQTEPTPTTTGAPFITSKMLVHQIDATLVRLTDRLREPLTMDRRRRDLVPFGEMRAGCHCGLHLLLAYYLAGARALREVLPAAFGVERVEVLHVFNQLGHDDMAALCGICHHRGGALCCLPLEPVAQPPGIMVNPPGGIPG